MSLAMKRTGLSLVLIATAFLCGCDYGTQPGSTGTGSGAADGSTPEAAAPNKSKDTAFLAKPSPEEALAAWAAALKTGGKAAHEQASLNEREWSEDHWNTALDAAIQLINADSLSPQQFIVEGDFAEALLEPGHGLNGVCLVRTDDGWCVLTSIGDWSSMGDDRYGDGEALNTINGKVLEAQLQRMQGNR